MDVFTNLHDYHIALIGLNYISQNSLRHLIFHYIVQERNLLGIQNSDNDRKKFSKLFKYLQASPALERQKQRLDRQLNARILPRIYTDKARSQVKDEVEYEAFDISAMENILRCIQLFPFSQKRNIKCRPQLPTTHLGKCCVGCDEKHNCITCGLEICQNGCCLSDYFHCDHLCRCSWLRSECKENSIVCCEVCRLCYFCNITECVNSRIRKAINILFSIRHLLSHATDHTWQQLSDGTFDSEDFRSFRSWDELCRYVTPHYCAILKYLNKKCLIQQDEYQDFRYYIKKLHCFKKENIPSNFLERVLRMYREENTIQISSTSEPFTLEVIVKVKGTIPNRMHGIAGELSETMCVGIKKAILEGDGKTDQELESANVIVNPEVCDCNNRFLKRSRVSFIAKVRPTTVEKGAELRGYYDDKFAAKSNQFFQCIEQGCKKNLTNKRISGDVVLKGFKLGCIHLELDIVKSTNVGWNDDEIKILLPTLKDALIKAIGEGVQVDVFLQDDSLRSNEDFVVVFPNIFPTLPSKIDGAIDVDISARQENTRSSNEEVLPITKETSTVTTDNAVYLTAEQGNTSLSNEEDLLSTNETLAATTDEAVSFKEDEDSLISTTVTESPHLRFVFAISTVGSVTIDSLDPHLLSMKARQLAFNKLTEVVKHQRYVTFIGHVGVGKSFLLNRLLEHKMMMVEFKSDENIAYSLTTEIQQQEVGDTIYTDTPGYSDVYTSNATQKAVKGMLGHGGYHQVIFVITLASGRIRRNDVVMIKEVLKVSKDITKYGIIINKLSTKLYQILSSNQHYQSQILQLFLTSQDNRSAYLLLIPDVTVAEDLTAATINIYDELLEFSKSLSFVEVNKCDIYNTKSEVVGNLEEEIREIRDEVKQLRVMRMRAYRKNHRKLEMARRYHKEKLRQEIQRHSKQVSEFGARRNFAIKDSETEPESYTKTESYTETDSSISRGNSFSSLASDNDIGTPKIPEFRMRLSSCTSTGNETDVSFTKRIRRRKRHRKPKRSKKKTN